MTKRYGLDVTKAFKTISDLYKAGSFPTWICTYSAPCPIGACFNEEEQRLFDEIVDRRGMTNSGITISTLVNNGHIVLFGQKDGVPLDLARQRLQTVQTAHDEWSSAIRRGRVVEPYQKAFEHALAELGKITK